MFAFWTLHASTQTVVPSQTDEIIIDNGTSGKADPNDRIRYQVTIQNTGVAPAQGVQLNAVPDPRTTLVPGTFRSSPLAVPDMYTCTGNIGINVPAAQGVKVNDFDDDLPGTTLSCGACATANGGSVVLNNDGSFTYSPPAGFTGSDSFTYTITDGNPVGAPVPTTDMTSVTITVSNMVWFISNGSGGTGGTGTRLDPFRTLADFNAATGPSANQFVHLQNTGTNYNGGIVLKDGMTLVGTGHTGGITLADVLPFTVAPNSPTLPAINGMRPVIANTGGDGVTLAQNNNLRGFDVGNCSDFGMENSGTNSIGNLVVSEVRINNGTGGGFDASHGSGAGMNVVFDFLGSSGGTNGINLVDAAGIFNVIAGLIINPSGAAVSIVNGSVAFSYGGSITDNAGVAVLIDNHDSGNATFSGNINSTGAALIVQNCGGGTKTFSGPTKSLNTGATTAINLTNNTGATINFTNGGLAITTTSGVGFNATGGGTISVQGTNNTIASSGATALNVVNTTIGASDLNFLSLSSAGAADGIVLDGTGTSAGGLTVTGTGTTDGSGGTISNIINRGAKFINANKITLSNMVFNNAGNTNGGTCTASDNSGCNAALHFNTVNNVVLTNIDATGGAQQGINLREVNGFSLNNSIITQSGNEVVEGNLLAINLSGTVSITNNTFSFPAENCASIYNTSRNMTLTVTNSNFNDTQTSGVGSSGLSMGFYGTSVSTINISGSNFLRCKTNGTFVVSEGNSMTNITNTGATVDPGVGVGVAFDHAVNINGNLKYKILNGNLKGRATNIVNVFGFSGSFEGRVNGNTVQSLSGSGTGIRQVAQGATTAVSEANNNTITGITADSGISGVSQGGAGTLDITMIGNSITLANSAAYNIEARAGASSSTFTNKTCANVANNTVVGMPASNFFARTVNAHELRLQGGGATVATNWNANTNSPGTPPAVVSQSGSGTFTFGATCITPTN